MNRRAILKLFGSAPLAAPLALQETMKVAEVAEAAKASGMAMSIAQASASPSNVMWLMCEHPELLAAYKAGLLPDWVTTDMRNSTLERARELTTDIASLRSVSLSGKAYINRARVERQMQRNIVSDLTHQAARQAFFSQAYAKNRRGSTSP